MIHVIAAIELMAGKRDEFLKKSSTTGAQGEGRKRLLGIRAGH